MSMIVLLDAGRLGQLDDKFAFSRDEEPAVANRIRAGAPHANRSTA